MKRDNEELKRQKDDLSQRLEDAMKQLEKMKQTKDLAMSMSVSGKYTNKKK